MDWFKMYALYDFQDTKIGQSRGGGLGKMNALFFDGGLCINQRVYFLFKVEPALCLRFH